MRVIFQKKYKVGPKCGIFFLGFKVKTSAKIKDFIKTLFVYSI